MFCETKGAGDEQGWDLLLYYRLCPRSRIDFLSTTLVVLNVGLRHNILLLTGHGGPQLPDKAE